MSFCPDVLVRFKVCIHFARQLLKHKVWDLADFMIEWSKVLPSVSHPSVDMLYGEVLRDEARGTIKLFSRDHLPKECRSRVKAMFAEKKYWNPHELRVYIEGAKVSSVDALL